MRRFAHVGAGLFAAALHSVHAGETVLAHPANDWASMTNAEFRTIKADHQTVFVFDDHFVWDTVDGRHAVALPRHVLTFVPRYRTDRGPGDFIEVDESIGPIVAEGGKLWFGLEFYEDEGMEGVGGLGFLEPRSGALGLLRHPALVDCSVAELKVTAGAFLVRTRTEQSRCRSQVEIPRTPGMETAMLEQARFEWSWFSDAVRRGAVKHQQRCRVVAGKREETQCEPAVKLVEPGRGMLRVWDRGPGGSMERMVNYMVNRDLAATARCSPGWDGIHAGIALWPTGRMKVKAAPSDRYLVVPGGSEGATVRVREASHTEAWEWTMSELKVEPVACAKPQDSGPAFTRATIELKVIRVDQAYEPPK